MDQLKVILKHLKKYHFWLLCVVVMIAGMVGWSMARKALSAAYDTKSGAIKAKFTAIASITTAAEDPPNATWAVEANKLTEAEQKQVTATWTKVYEEQQKQLVWPTRLGEKFLKFVNESPEQAKIPGQLCAIYQTQIKDEMPELLKVVDAEQPDDDAAGVKTADSDTARVPKVEWDKANQLYIQSLIDWQETPSSLDVRQAQEDLWIYRLVLSIVRNVNEGHQGLPPVRRVSEIVLGKPAAEKFKDGMASGLIERPAAAPANGQVPPPESVPGPPPVGGGGGEEGGGAPGGAPAALFADNRYVDVTGKPMAGAAVAKLQFKRLPVFMRLTMDQTEIPKLLVECANSKLPLEVSQFRINTGTQGAGAKGAAPAASSAPRAAGSSMRGGASNMRGGGATKGADGPSEAPSADSDSHTVTVDLHAIVYLYNPPSTGDVTIEQQPGGAAGPGAPPPADGAPKGKKGGWRSRR